MAETATRRVPRLALALATAALCLLATAILIALNSGADPAEVDELAQKFTDTNDSLAIPITETQAHCRATIYLESDLSDGALADVRAGQPPRPRNDNDIKELAKIADELTRCI